MHPDTTCTIHAGFSPQIPEGGGGVIMGVYTLAEQTTPIPEDLLAPEKKMSAKGAALYEKIVENPEGQYTGRGAYTGFVDNHNIEGDTDPVGPRSTARFLAPEPGLLEPDPHSRWRPPFDKEALLDGTKTAAVWQKRKRPGLQDGYVPWGMIGGDRATEPPDPNKNNAGVVTNLSDQMTLNMEELGMVFNGSVTENDIAAYTHGMIQAIYKAYALRPSCQPYEIAVGGETTKLASCIPCTLFMVALGYPPTSIHLGRGESWAPLYEPYNPQGFTDFNEPAVIRDLNNTWYECCLQWLKIGLEVLDDEHIQDDHKPGRNALRDYLSAYEDDKTVGGVLILDAETIHKPEQDRINSTLRG